MPLPRPPAVLHPPAASPASPSRTYDKFLNSHERKLKELPPTRTAVEYYGSSSGEDRQGFHYGGDLNHRSCGQREVNTLYDVFVLVRDDEMEHFRAMSACAEADVHECDGVVECLIRSPTGDGRDGDIVILDEED